MQLRTVRVQALVLLKFSNTPNLNLNVHTDHIILTFPRSVGPSEVIINLDMH